MALIKAVARRTSPSWPGVASIAIGRSFALDLRQPRNSMTLKATMKGRAGQMRNRRLQCVEAIVERQQGVPSEGDDHGFFLNGQDR
jgi:hypothetical protein